ncbi:hypothetical protein WMF04_05055 [Sorangium sp. So ce260]|uniref:hypothetical protein n=1 Tax=Sorangium sp. So ce260 TaxID=3133291 RepID=UPI003F607CF0
MIAACRGDSSNSTAGGSSAGSSSSSSSAAGGGVSAGCEYEYGPELLNFPTDLDSLGEMPPDVCPPSPSGSPCGSACPGGTCDQAALDRLHDIFAWRLFVAANWPHTATEAQRSGDTGSGDDPVVKPQPAPRLSGAGVPLWRTWRNVSDAFGRDTREDEDEEECQDVNVKEGISSGWTEPLPPRDNPVWDQNGNPVKLEARMNERSYTQFVTEFGVNDVLRQLAAQCAADECRDESSTSCRGLSGQIVTWGRYPDPDDCGTRADGNEPLVHVKLAWKKLGPCDEPGRFILHEDGAHGLVAMHVAAKTAMTKASWFWATFEHVDNLEPAEPWRKPLFRDPSCQDCVPNKCPLPVPGAPRRTQIERLAPIPAGVAALNGEVRALFKQRGHVLQHYQLIGTEGREGMDQVKCSLDGEPTHVPLDVSRPAPLANAIIEWDRQDVSCLACHARAKGVVFKSPSTDCDGCGLDTCPGAKEGDVRFGEGCADFFWQAARAAWNPIVNTEQ